MGKLANTWVLNNIHLNKHWIKEQIKIEFKKCRRQMKTTIQYIKTYGIQQKQF